MVTIKTKTALDQTVFVVDDDEAARKSLTFLLRTEGITARAYASGPAFLAQLQPGQLGCVVADVRMPEMDGIALVQRLKELGCQLPVIVITGHADVPLAVQAMKAGATDFIEKPFESDTILSAVRRGLEASRSMEAQECERSVIERRKATLTDRERQVFDAVCSGLSNKEIAQSLRISPRTVEIHRARLMAKMEAASLTELVKMNLGAPARGV